MNNNTTIALTTVIQRNDKKFLANKLGEEMVMMNLESGDFVSMNNVGADIWGLCEQPIAISDLVQNLRRIYDITEAQCIQETMQFLKASSEQSLFVFHNTSNT